MADRTDENLQTAFMGESAAVRRYTIFAEKAEDDGQPQVARLFRAAARAEAIHARNHLTVMGAIGSTKDNLLAAVIGEQQETSGMYPIMIEEAQQERNERAEQSFAWANSVERGHQLMFELALATIKAGEEPEATDYYVCRVCGNTVRATAPAKCSVCGAGDSYEEVA